MNLQKNIGRTIKLLRSRLGMSQEKLALDAGIDRRYMSDIENGNRNISIDILDRLAMGLGIDPSALLKRAEEIDLPNLTLAALKEMLCERGFEETIVLENPDYLSAVLGVSNDERVVYSYSKMVEHLVETDGMDPEEAVEFIDYNTINALPYAGDKAPIILYDDMYF